MDTANSKIDELQWLESMRSKAFKYMRKVITNKRAKLATVQILKYKVIFISKNYMNSFLKLSKAQLNLLGMQQLCQTDPLKLQFAQMFQA